jgi:hypothetical protein
MTQGAGCLHCLNCLTCINCFNCLTCYTGCLDKIALPFSKGCDFVMSLLELSFHAFYIVCLRCLTISMQFTVVLKCFLMFLNAWHCSCILHCVFDMLNNSMQFTIFVDKFHSFYNVFLTCLTIFMHVHIFYIIILQCVFDTLVIILESQPDVVK